MSINLASIYCMTQYCKIKHLVNDSKKKGDDNMSQATLSIRVNSEDKKRLRSRNAVHTTETDREKVSCLHIIIS